MDLQRLSRLRVLLVSARYPPFTGGTEIHVAEVARRLVARGHLATVLTTSLNKADVGEEVVDGVHVIRVRAYPPNSDLHVSPGIWKGVLALRPDVVHVQGYHTFVAPAAMLAARRADLPYVVTFHSGGHSSAIRRAIRPLQHRLLRPLLSQAQQLLAVSDFESSLLQQQLHLPPVRFRTVPNGVSDVFWTVERPLDAQPVISSVGRAEHYKGHHRLIMAMPQVLTRLPGARLQIIGRGPYEETLRKLSRTLGVHDNVDFISVPATDRLAMAQLLAGSSLVTLLSTFESQGIAAREALATGTRLLVADTSALAELRRFPDVRMVAPNCEIENLADIIVGELTGARCADRTVAGTWDDTTDSLEQIYRAAVDQSHRHR